MKSFDVQVNRDLISNEMQQMRQQLKYLQAELCSRAVGASLDEVLVYILYNFLLSNFISHFFFFACIIVNTFDLTGSQRKDCLA